MYKYKVTTEPTIEPVTLAEAKLNLRETETAQDDVITELIKTARQWCEAYENTKYITQTITQVYDVLREQMDLAVGKAQSVTSIKYQDQDNSQQTLSSSLYALDSYSTPPCVYAVYNATYPSSLTYRNSVEIIYVAGYGDTAADVPERIKQAIKLILNHLYEHREQDSEVTLKTIPTNAKDFLFERAF